MAIVIRNCSPKTLPRSSERKAVQVTLCPTSSQAMMPKMVLISDAIGKTKDIINTNTPSANGSQNRTLARLSATSTCLSVMLTPGSMESARWFNRSKASTTSSL